MKLTKGKLSKLYAKNRQSVKKNKKKRGSNKRKTFRKHKGINLANKTLKHLHFRKHGGNGDSYIDNDSHVIVPEYDTKKKEGGFKMPFKKSSKKKYEPVPSDIELSTMNNPLQPAQPVSQPVSQNNNSNQKNISETEIFKPVENPMHSPEKMTYSPDVVSNKPPENLDLEPANESVLYNQDSDVYNPLQQSDSQAVQTKNEPLSLLEDTNLPQSNEAPLIPLNSSLPVADVDSSLVAPPPVSEIVSEPIEESSLVAPPPVSEIVSEPVEESSLVAPPVSEIVSEPIEESSLVAPPVSEIVSEPIEESSLVAPPPVSEIVSEPIEESSLVAPPVSEIVSEPVEENLLFAPPLEEPSVVDSSAEESSLVAPPLEDLSVAPPLVEPSVVDSSAEVSSLVAPVVVNEMDNKINQSLRVAFDHAIDRFSENLKGSILQNYGNQNGFNSNNIAAGIMASSGGKRKKTRKFRITNKNKKTRGKR